MRSHSQWIIVTAIFAFCLSAPVLANPAAIQQTSTSIPEPSDFALFLMGVTGLIIGRRSSRRRHPRDEDTKA